jgi:hypothetical protein
VVAVADDLAATFAAFRAADSANLLRRSAERAVAGGMSGPRPVDPGAGTRLIGLAAGAAPGLLTRYMDNRIARAQRAANP